MPELGRWVLAQACREQAKHGLPVHVNVSPQELLDPSYPTQVAEALEATGCPQKPWSWRSRKPPSSPTSGAGTPAKPSRPSGPWGQGLLGRLRLRLFQPRAAGGTARGRGQAGPGLHPSLGLPPDPEGAPGRLVAAVLALAQTLGLAAVAEGIEDEAARDYLRNLGFPLGQGYLWGKPEPI